MRSLRGNQKNRVRDRKGLFPHPYDILPPPLPFHHRLHPTFWHHPKSRSPPHPHSRHFTLWTPWPPFTITKITPLPTLSSHDGTRHRRRVHTLSPKPHHKKPISSKYLLLSLLDTTIVTFVPHGPNRTKPKHRIESWVCVPKPRARRRRNTTHRSYRKRGSIHRVYRPAHWGHRGPQGERERGGDRRRRPPVDIWSLYTTYLHLIFILPPYFIV